MTDRPSAPLDDFKERELEILNLMAQGASNQEIADTLYITKGTVRWYNKQIYSKLGTSRRTEAIAYAREMGLIGDDDIHADTEHLVTKHSLPLTTGCFVGREDDLANLSSLLNQPDIRLISIIAAGGMGKSRLALELGHLIIRDFEHGAAFVDLSTIRNPDDIASLTLASLRVQLTEHADHQETLFNYCREKDLLLIFDNFEHILQGTNLLSELLEIAPNLRLIATSREKLNLRVETTYYLDPITEHGAKLFTEVASMMHPTIALAAEDLSAINQIVALVGGSPLGLLLAATWLDILTVDEIIEEIKTSLEFLSSNMGDMPKRQQSIHAVIDPTWKRLRDDEKQAFMWASVFRGGFTREMFQQLTGASIRTLQTLLNRSLITHGNSRHYNLHPLLRQYAREKLDTHKMLADAKNQHLRVLRQYAEHHAQQMFTGHYLAALDALERETDNIRAALDWSLQGHQIDDGVALILANGEFWLTRSRSQQAMSYIEQAIQLSDHPKLHYWYSVYLDRLGLVDRAREAANQATELAEALGDDELIAYGKLQMMILESNVTEAHAIVEAALSHALKTENKHLIAMCYSYLGLLYPSVKHLITEAKDDFYYQEKALAIYEELGDLRGISRITNNIAIQHYDHNQKAQAQALIETSLELKRAIGDKAGEARRLTTLSLWAMEEEELERAQTWLDKSRRICEELGELERLSYVLTVEGLLHMMTTDFKQSQAIFERGLELNIRVDDRRGVVDVYAMLCFVHLMQTQLDEATFAIHQAIEAAKLTGKQNNILLIVYATYLWHRQDFSDALRILGFVANRDLNVYSGSHAIIDKYLLQPLIYQVQQHIGIEAWQHALNDASEVTEAQIIEWIFENVSTDI